MIYGDWGVLETQWELLVIDQAGHNICEMPKLNEHKPNAYLIAAAPDLHRQLMRSNELIKWLDAEHRLSQNPQTSDNIDLVMTENNKALSKAERREE